MNELESSPFSAEPLLDKEVLTADGQQGSLGFAVDALSRTRQKGIVEAPSDWVPEVLPSNGERLPIEIHKEHSFEVLSRLLEAYEKKEFPYSEDRTRLPHDPRHMPKVFHGGDKERAMFFFNSCYYMRGGIKSTQAMIRLTRLYEAYPELFDCKKVSSISPDDVKEKLSEFGFGFQDISSKIWVENSRRLLERYDGDPRNIFADGSGYEGALQKIPNKGKNGFAGFQRKMTSMITYYLMDEGLIEPFRFPLPVDLHVLRISIANEFLTFPGVPHGTNLYTEETLDALYDLYGEFAQMEHVDPLKVCDAVWMLSESTCGIHPGNTTLEPLGRQNRNGRMTYLVPGPVRTDSLAQQALYAASCLRCPIEQSCKYNIPGTPYYVAGAAIIRGRRENRYPVSEPLF